MTRTELIQGTTMAEFSLAQHVRSASYAKACLVDAQLSKSNQARKLCLASARTWGLEARRDLAGYVSAKALELSRA